MDIWISIARHTEPKSILSLILTCKALKNRIYEDEIVTSLWFGYYVPPKEQNIRLMWWLHNTSVILHDHPSKILRLCCAKEHLKTEIGCVLLTNQIPTEKPEVGYNALIEIFRLESMYKSLINDGKVALSTLLTLFISTQEFTNLIYCRPIGLAYLYNLFKDMSVVFQISGQYFRVHFSKYPTLKLIHRNIDLKNMTIIPLETIPNFVLTDKHIENFHWYGKKMALYKTIKLQQKSGLFSFSLFSRYYEKMALLCKHPDSSVNIPARELLNSYRLYCLEPTMLTDPLLRNEHNHWLADQIELVALQSSVSTSKIASSPFESID